MWTLVSKPSGCHRQVCGCVSGQPSSSSMTEDRYWYSAIVTGHAWRDTDYHSYYWLGSQKYWWRDQLALWIGSRRIEKQRRLSGQRHSNNIQVTHTVGRRFCQWSFARATVGPTVQIGWPLSSHAGRMVVVDVDWPRRSGCNVVDMYASVCPPVSLIADSLWVRKTDVSPTLSYAYWSTCNCCMAVDAVVTARPSWLRSCVVLRAWWSY